MRVHGLGSTITCKAPTLGGTGAHPGVVGRPLVSTLKRTEVTISQIRNRRVLVTGASGFLGQSVCPEVLQLEPAELFTPRRSDFDLTEQADVRHLLDTCRPDIVLHLAAAVGGIGANRANPGRFFYENAAMGILLLEESRRRSVHKFVNVCTVCAYPKHTAVPFIETDLWNGYPEETNAAFGIAKKAVLTQGQAYRDQYGMSTISLIPSNLYGPGDNFDPATSHVIPALIRRAIEARESGSDFLDVWGTGAATREFLYVRDAARGIVMATEAYDGRDPVNLGTGEEVSIHAAAELICALVGFRGELRWDPTKPDGQPRRCIDVSRAVDGFGFRATTTFRDGLREAIASYEARRRATDAPPPTTAGRS